MKPIAALFAVIAMAGCSVHTTEEPQPVVDHEPTSPAPTQTATAATPKTCAERIPGMYRMKPITTVGVGDCAAFSASLGDFTRADRILVAVGENGAWTATYPLSRDLPVQSLTFDGDACDLSSVETEDGVTTITTLVQTGLDLLVRREISTDSCNVSVSTTALRSTD